MWRRHSVAHGLQRLRGPSPGHQLASSCPQRPAERNSTSLCLVIPKPCPSILSCCGRLKDIARSGTLMRARSISSLPVEQHDYSPDVTAEAIPGGGAVENSTVDVVARKGGVLNVIDSALLSSPTKDEDDERAWLHPWDLKLTQHFDSTRRGEFSNESPTMEKPGDEEAPQSSESMEVQSQSAQSEESVFEAFTMPEDPLLKNLEAAIRSKNAKQSIQLFREGVETRALMNEELLENLFKIQLRYSPPNAFDVMRHGQYLGFDMFVANKDLYKSLCEAVGRLDGPNVGSNNRCRAFVLELEQDIIQNCSKELQNQALPQLLLGMISQRLHSVGKRAFPLYEFMKEHDIPIPGRIAEAILSQGRFTRRFDLPFHDILDGLVKDNFKVGPAAVRNTLQNLHPFTDTKALAVVVDALSQLSKSSGAAYQVDLGTLEAMASATARIGNPEVCLRLLEFAEELGYEATEAMYESLAHSLVRGHGGDKAMFIVLNEMEAKGFIPSRALIRSLSGSLRWSVNRIDFSYHSLMAEGTKGVSPSVSSLNVIMSACAERGEVNRAFFVFEDFNRLGIKPNGDSYSFAMKALANSTWQVKSGEDVTAKLEAAESILDMMQEEKAVIDRNVLHYYTLVLANVSKLDAANTVVGDAIAAGFDVSEKTLRTLASINKKLGKIEDSDKLVAFSSRSHQIHDATETQNEEPNKNDTLQKGVPEDSCA